MRKYTVVVTEKPNGLYEFELNGLSPNINMKIKDVPDFSEKGVAASFEDAMVESTKIVKKLRSASLGIHSL